MKRQIAEDKEGGIPNEDQVEEFKMKPGEN